MMHIKQDVAQNVEESIERMRSTVFDPAGSFSGVDEVKHFTIGFATYLEDWMRIRTGTEWAFNSWEQDLPWTASRWIGQLKYQNYVIGQGSWITAIVNISASRDETCEIELHDHEIYPIAASGGLEAPFKYANAMNVQFELRQFPRTLENIPAWMLERLAAENLEVPLYNSELGTLDWDNQRWPVGPYGVEPDAKPVVIDKKLSAKKFGRKMLFGRDG